jgi:transposase
LSIKATDTIRIGLCFESFEKTLRKDFKGTLISDGYAAYASYAKQNENITHAQCWVHSRCTFIEAESQEPGAVREALDYIAALYHIEDQAHAKNLSGDPKH